MFINDYLSYRNHIKCVFFILHAAIATIETVVEFIC